MAPGEPAQHPGRLPQGCDHSQHCGAQLPLQHFLWPPGPGPVPGEAGPGQDVRGAVSGAGQDPGGEQGTGGQDH